MSKWYRPYLAPIRNGMRRIRRKIFPKRLNSSFDPSMFIREYENSILNEEISVGYNVDDGTILRRIVSSYKMETSEYDNPSDMWEYIFNKKQKNTHDILINGDEGSIRDILRQPSKYEYMYGFAPFTKENASDFSKYTKRKTNGKSIIKEVLILLAESLGALRCENPETGRRLYRDISNDDLLGAIERKLGVELRSPNPFPDEIGVRTQRGIVDFRAAQAIYQAWRVRDLTASIEKPKVLEIGGGLGKTAYYSWLLGIQDYTIVDLPFTGVSQANYLMRILGEDAVVLHGEPVGATDKIKLLRPSVFLDSDQRYDLILNVDSMTEMGREVAERYFSKIATSTDTFLSINHEANRYTVAEIADEQRPKIKSTQRSLYALRRGYAEELFTF